MPPNNERTHNIYEVSPMPIDEHFCKDGFIYLLKGTADELPDGIKSRLFREGVRLSDTNYDIEQITFYQSIGMPTPFISTTTNYKTAAQFAGNGKIYVIKIPYADVYRSFNTLQGTLKESEYFVPDIISPDEMIKLFDANDFKGIYDYLKNVIGLDILPEDIGLSCEELTNAMYIPGIGVFLPSPPTYYNAETKGIKQK